MDYRNNQKIAHDLGTAVNVVTMVFGNMGDDSGTGVAFTRDPNTGEKVLFGEYLTNAQGEDVVAGIRTAPKISQMQTDMPEVYGEFVRIGEQLEKHYRDVQDLEFTIERGKLYMLQTRSAKRTAAAAVKIATDLVERGRHHARKRRSAGSSRRTSTSSCATSSTRGARAAAHADRQGPQRVARRRGRAGRLRRRHRGRMGRPWRARRARPDRDLAGRLPRDGRRPGDPDRPRRRDSATPRSSPARSASRAWPVATSWSSTMRRGRPSANGVTFAEGDWISVDGSTGEVFLGALPTVSARFEDQPELQTILGWADEVRRMQVWTNADKPEEAAMARTLRRAGHRPVPDRAHVPRGRAARDRAWRDPRRDGRDPGQGQGGRRRHADRRRVRGGRDLRRRDGQARGPPAGRLRGDLPGDGRPARGHPADRPAAPRVPAEPRGPAGQGDPRRGRPAARPRRTRSCWRRSRASTSRTRCSGCAAAGSG